MAHYARNDPSSSRRLMSSRAGVPFKVPEIGTTNVDEDEDQGQVVGRVSSLSIWSMKRERTLTPQKAQRKPPLFGPHTTLGRNTLNEAKLIFTNTEVPPSSFYQKQRDGVQTRGNHRQTKVAAPSLQSLVAGVPGPNMQEVHRLSSEKLSPPAQYRNANKATAGAKRKETIEITDSSDDEVKEVAAAGPSRPRSSSQHSLTQTASASRSASISGSGSQNGKNHFGDAHIAGSIKRKSESPPEVTNWSAKEEGIRVLSPRSVTPELPPLPASRHFHISGVPSTTDDDSGDKTVRTSLASRMKDKEGKKKSLGGRMESGLKGKGLVGVVKNVKESPSRPILPAVTPPAADEPRLRLANVGFFELAQISSTTSNPTLTWDDGCNLHLRWTQGEEDKSLIFQTANISRIEMYNEGPDRCMSVRFRDHGKVLTKLCTKIGQAGSDVLMQPRKYSDNILLIPLADYSRALVDAQAWADLLKVVDESLISDLYMTHGSFLSLTSMLKGLQDLVRASEVKKPKQLQPKPRPTAARTSIGKEPLSTRSSSRHKREASGTEEEEKASRGSVEAVTKVQTPMEPQKALLSYPMAAPGAVNVFQSDVDKLDEQEMLNDTIIELGLRYLLEEIKKRDPELHEQVYVFSSFFYKRISEGRRDRKAAYEFVKKWTKKIDIFKKRYLVVPINEKMHWYLAVVTNPYYAVREVERRRGLYESDQEEEEKDASSKEDKTNGDEAIDEGDKKANKDASAASEEEEEEADEHVLARTETLGDTPMKEAKTTTVEVVIPHSSIKSDKSARDKAAEQMEVDDKPIFEMIQSPELEERAVEKKMQTIPVVDIRSSGGPFTLAHAIDLDDNDSDVQVTTPSTSQKRTKPSRPGISDGFRNKGKGSLVGGGGLSGTPIEAGQIASFHDEEEEASAAVTRKRKAKDEERDGDARMESPLSRSRSGAPSGERLKPATYRRASSMEMIQEKHQQWLKRKAVVCVFDSLGGSHKAVRTALREYLCLEYNDKRGGQIEVDEVELEHIDVLSPMQGNFCDCGLYLLHAFERFFHDPTRVMDKVIVLRDRADPYWQAEDAAKKRQWWRECIRSLIEEYKAEQARLKAEKETRKRAGGGKEKSETTSPSDGRSRSATSEASQLDMASVESSLEEPTVSKAI